MKVKLIVFALLTFSMASFKSYALNQIPENAPSPATPVKIITSGNKSLSLNDQLKGVSAPKPAIVNTPKPQMPPTPKALGNEAEINALGISLHNAFQNADKSADKFTKAEQYILYLLYKQAEQNQIQLKQNNTMISTLKQIAAQNNRLITLINNLNHPENE